MPEGVAHSPDLALAADKNLDLGRSPHAKNAELDSVAVVSMRCRLMIPLLVVGHTQVYSVAGPDRTGSTGLDRAPPESFVIGK